jgi:hypothetical protein
LPARTAAALVQGEDAHGVAGGFAGAGRVGSEDEASDVEQRRVDIGFTSNTSRAAPRIWPVRRAAINAVSSTTPPRAVLIRYAVGFMTRRAAASIRW